MGVGEDRKLTPTVTCHGSNHATGKSGPPIVGLATQSDSRFGYIFIARGVYTMAVVVIIFGYWNSGV